MRRSILLILLFFITPLLVFGNRLSGIKNFAFYYGGDELEKLANYDLVVLEPENYTREDIEWLKSKGVKVVSYVTIGESDTKDVKPEWVLAENPNWHSLIIDVRHEGWRKRVISYMKKLKEKGFDGFFLDTVDTAVSYPETKDAMVEFIREIRETFPDAILIQNRGFPLLDETGDYIDGVLWEDFASAYDWISGRYRKVEISDVFVKQMKELAKKHDFIILALNYSWEDDVDLRGYIYEMCRKYEMLCFTTDLYLTKLYVEYKPGMTFPKKRFDFSNVVDTIVIGENDSDYLYGEGWIASGTLYSTNYKRCKGWDAGLILTFSERENSGFYVMYYDGGLEDMALKITTYNGHSWPFIASIPIGESGMFKVAEVKVEKGALYDTDAEKPGIQQKFGFQGAKVAVIGRIDKPELNVGGVKIYRRRGKIRVKFKIGNSSPIEARNVRFVVKDQSGSILTKKTVEKLAMNEEESVILRFKESGSVEKLIVEIDPDNEISEIIETNNRIVINLEK